MIAWMIGGYAMTGVIIAVFLVDLAMPNVNVPPDTVAPVKVIVGLFWPLVIAAMLVAALWFAGTDVWGRIRRRKP